MRISEQFHKTEEIIAVIEQTRKAEGIPYVDDHSQAFRNRISAGYMVFRNHNMEYVCCIPASDEGVAAKHFCINPFYIGEDGLLHLSMMSVGGNVSLTYCEMPEAVERYNKEREEWPWVTGRILKYVP